MVQHTKIYRKDDEDYSKVFSDCCKYFPATNYTVKSFTSVGLKFCGVLEKRIFVGL